MYTTPAYLAITVALNVSVTLAVYALILFYHAFAEVIGDRNPLRKFLCIKGVVFATFCKKYLLLKLLSLVCHVCV